VKVLVREHRELADFETLELEGNKTTDSESKMLCAVEKIRQLSPVADKQPPSFNRQTSREMEDAVQVQRPMCKKSIDMIVSKIESLNTETGGEVDLLTSGSSSDNFNLANDEISNIKHISNEAVEEANIKSKEKSKIDKRENLVESKDLPVSSQSALPAYAGLPIDESCGCWMDENIIPIVDSEEDEIDIIPLTNKNN